MKRYVYIDDDESSHDLYCDNRISNRKYTLLNFLPKNLWEQFSRFMNQYFLLIACLQLWPLITPVNPASTWGPLIFIFAVSASKEAWDDYNRYLSDKKANQKEVWVVRKGVKKLIQAQDIHVGNIIWLRENDEVPCDLVLIGTSDPQGVCYIETSALDGETDLKTRVIPSACMGIDVELLHKIKGVIECPSPDKDVMRFDANVRLYPPFIDNDVCPLTIKNTILQSCYLRNTEWACGVAIYTGNETKLGMSRGIPEPKLTAMDAMIDKLTGAIFIFQIVVVLVLGIAGNVWKDTEARKQWYVLYPHEGPWYELLVIPLRFELLCSIMIPISIKVSLDLMKSLYAKFIDWDHQMIDLETSIPSHATNTAISEDLGQVEYILTDKTGTLTENKMIFRRCCISGIFYGNESGDALKDVELLNAISSGSSDAVLFLTIMAICNTVIPTRSKTGDILYKAQSQDEDALVQAAAQLHMIFFNKSGNILEVKFNTSILQYEVLEILEFTSDRKRMSVVLKDCQNEKILLLSKGADEAILPYARAGQQTRHFIDAVEQYAHLGLRTLCLAWRELKKDEYQDWSLMFKEASSALVDREWRIAEVCQRVEHDLEILGVTAIEDRLQDGVPETIETLRKAGINFWMLTGDKQNTAIQIALSCNFISPEPKGQLLLIDGKTEDEVCRSLERVLRTMRITTSEPKDVAFVVDGWALEIALKHYRKAFTELAVLSRTAICCRVTPSQKAQLVQILKSCDYRTLAIGDGGNDVRMIQQADIGVGISGREGLQAARAADYSIGKFRFLKRLILVHGRYSYNRTAFLSQYSFYKSLLICFIQILLKKALYGLKQSPRAWFGRFTKVMTSLGYKQSQGDHTLFIKHSPQGGVTVLLVYVDDIIMTGDDWKEQHILSHCLAKEFEIKALGKLKYFLGIEVAHSRKGIFISQQKYIADLLKETGKTACKPASVPMDPNLKLGNTEDVAVDKEMYQRLVGRLIYLSHTRPDIAYAVSMVSQFMHCPKEIHLQAVHRIMQYLKGTPGRGILFKRNGNTTLEAYTDADYAGSIVDRRSTTGYCTFLGGNLVTWRSKKQNVVARSSAEAEFRAMAQGICELLWLKIILEDLKIKWEGPMKLYCDNKSAISIAHNPVQHDRTKHIEVDRHFIKEKLDSGLICTPYVSSHGQLADILTKGLSCSNFERIISKLGMENT
ncbi:phospholipid-transporting ATPase 2-like isoform X1 [Vicia villosa]|uniref:phospholipid-transporting ATPase 2-like isoform X1 n=1 Tax=Vicia villosa TaxID=3911 RepID=UPI00273A78C9|nr:phospholipid-transporting ATPase 2-like isoform X1 [Vicia villosa]